MDNSSEPNSSNSTSAPVINSDQPLAQSLPSPEDKSSKRLKFIIIILMIGLLIIAAIAGAYFFFVRNQKQSNIVINPKTKAVATGWLTYKSTHSDIEFSYPASRELADASSSATNKNTLEQIELHGPRGFIMTYELDKQFVNPSMACVAGKYGPLVSINDNYNMAMELDITKNVDFAFLESKNNISFNNAFKNGAGCGLNFYPNIVAPKQQYTFSMHYDAVYSNAKNCNSGKNSQELTADCASSRVGATSTDYPALPEVVTAKAIFATFKPATPTATTP